MSFDSLPAPDLSWIVYGVIFFAVLLGVEGLNLYLREVRGGKKRINQRLELISRGVPRDEILSLMRRRVARANGVLPLARIVAWLDGVLTQGGSRLSAARVLTLMAVATAVVAVVMLAVVQTLGSFPLLPSLLLVSFAALTIGFGLPLTVMTGKARKRLAKFEKQFPVALDIFVRGLRAGHPVAAALDLLTAEMPDPIGSEFGIVIDELNYGLDLRDALASLADRLPSQDVQMFVVSVAIQSETGGNLAEILEGLARVIRDRASMVLKVRALASEGKMTGWMLSVLPCFTFTLVFTTSPSFYLDVVDDPIFLPAMCGVLLTYATGVFTMRKMVDLKV